MGDTTMADADLAGGRGCYGAGHTKKRKIMLELEGLPYDPVERINPDGSVVMLPPQDPEDEVRHLPQRDHPSPGRISLPNPPPSILLCDAAFATTSRQPPTSLPPSRP